MAPNHSKLTLVSDSSNASSYRSPDKSFAANMAGVAKWGAAFRKKLKANPPWTPLTKFEHFEKLPLELRLMVWNLSLEPRTVEMRFIKNRRSTQFDIVADIPAVLHINQETRGEFQKRYKVMFAHKQCKAPAYFCSAIDTFHIRNVVRRAPGILDHVPRQQLTRTLTLLPNKSDIRHLSIAADCFSILTWLVFDVPLVLAYEQLETFCVSIIQGGHDCRQHNPNIRRTGPSYSHLSSLSHPLQLNEQKRINLYESLIRCFVDRWEAGRWGYTWTKPNFVIKLLCLESIYPTKLYCPPLGLGRAQKTRDDKKEKSRQLRPRKAANLLAGGKENTALTEPREAKFPATVHTDN